VPNNIAEGALTNGALPNTTCLDITRKLEVSFFGCHYSGGPQFIEYSIDKELKKEESCFEFVTSLRLAVCHKRKSYQEWNYNVTSNQIVHKITKKCLASDESKKKVIVENCEEGKLQQQWMFQFLFKEKLEKLE
jgi:hypothetical protein